MLIIVLLLDFNDLFHHTVSIIITVTLKLFANTSDTVTKWSAKVTAGVCCLCLSISSSKQEILKQKFAMANFGIFSYIFMDYDTFLPHFL